MATDKFHRVIDLIEPVAESKDIRVRSLAPLEIIIASSAGECIVPSSTKQFIITAQAKHPVVRKRSGQKLHASKRCTAAPHDVHTAIQQILKGQRGAVKELKFIDRSKRPHEHQPLVPDTHRERVSASVGFKAHNSRVNPCAKHHPVHVTWRTSIINEINPIADVPQIGVTAGTTHQDVVSRSSGDLVVARTGFDCVHAGCPSEHIICFCATHLIEQFFQGNLKIAHDLVLIAGEFHAPGHQRARLIGRIEPRENDLVASGRDGDRELPATHDKCKIARSDARPKSQRVEFAGCRDIVDGGGAIEGFEVVGVVAGAPA